MTILLGSPILLTIGTFFITAIIVHWRRNERSGNPRCLPHPPGPKGYPLIGNLLTIPRKQHWLGLKELSERYGDIVFFKSLGMNYLILDSVKRTTDILENRAAKYASRGGTTLLLDLMGWDFNFAFIEYGNWWRRHRKVIHDYFNPALVDKYDEVQTREIYALLGRLLETPDEFQKHIPLTLAAITIDIAYGIRIPSETKNNPYVSMAHEAFSEGLAVAGIPGMHMVDHFPILKWLPAWFPGAGFQTVASQARAVVEEITLTKTLDQVRKSMRDGTQQPSIASGLLSKIPPDVDPSTRLEEERLVQNVAAAVYAAGTDTTASSISAFFLAMAMFPDAQKKAQAEIDSITRGSQLPDYGDRPSMPYMEALLLELMRWHPVAPLAGPHMSTEDDEYDGYFIPKGTFVFGNVWSLFNDPEVFQDPSRFNPDRYIENPNLRNPDIGFWGFGRRMCPGRFFASRNLFMTISTVLSVFDILPPIDKDGNPIPLEHGATTGLVSHPNDFTCRIVPRSAAAKKLILEAQLQWDGNY